MLSRFQTFFSLVFLSALALMLPSVSYANKIVPTGPVAPDPPSICNGVSGNIVTNCGFETGFFTGWTLSNTNATSVESFGFDEGPNSGSYFAALGNVGTNGTVSQTLSTVIGQTYDISFWLASDGGTPSDFSASFGSTVLLSLTNTPATAYVQYSFVDVATSTSTVLTFTERNDPSYWGLDDVSVVQTGISTPEPGVPLLLSISLVGLAVLAWKLDRSGASSTSQASVV